MALQAWAVTAELFPEEGAARAVQLSRRSAKLAPTVDAVVRQYGYEELERALGSLPADEQRALRDLIAAAREKL